MDSTWNRDQPLPILWSVVSQPVPAEGTLEERFKKPYPNIQMKIVKQSGLRVTKMALGQPFKAPLHKGQGTELVRGIFV